MWFFSQRLDPECVCNRLTCQDLITKRQVGKLSQAYLEGMPLDCQSSRLDSLVLENSDSSRKAVITTYETR